MTALFLDDALLLAVDALTRGDVEAAMVAMQDAERCGAVRDLAKARALHHEFTALAERELSRVQAELSTRSTAHAARTAYRSSFSDGASQPMK